MNKVQCLLIHLGVPKSLQGEAIIATTYLYNITLYSSLKDFISPFKAKYNRKLKLDYIPTFGTIYFYRDNKPKLKLDPRGYKAIIIGYSNEAFLYKVQNIETKAILQSRDIKIRKNTFLKSSIQPLEELKEGEETSSNPDQVADTITLPPIPVIKKRLIDIEEDTSLKRVIQPRTDFFIEIPILNKETAKYYNTIYKDILNIIIGPLDRTKDCTYKAIEEYLLITNLNNKPNSYKEAIKRGDSLKQLESIKEEIDEINNQNTQSLIDLPKGRKALGGRQVYKLKTDSDNNIIRYKSRQVI